MRFMVIENGIAVNAILAESADAVPGLTLVQSDTASIGEVWDGQVFSLPPPPPANKDKLAADIDAAVAAITSRYAPFLEEYKTRETQAREFAAANYTGPVPQQVAAFATPSGKTPQEATQIIIGQADGLRTASYLLGVQRMRKYEVLRAATDEEARAAHANVMATIAAIGARIG